MCCDHVSSLFVWNPGWSLYRLACQSWGPVTARLLNLTKLWQNMQHHTKHNRLLIWLKPNTKVRVSVCDNFPLKSVCHPLSCWKSLSWLCCIQRDAITVQSPLKLWGNSYSVHFPLNNLHVACYRFRHFKVGLSCSFLVSLENKHVVYKMSSTDLSRNWWRMGFAV